MRSVLIKFLFAAVFSACITPLSAGVWQGDIGDKKTDEINQKLILKNGVKIKDGQLTFDAGAGSLVEVPFSSSLNADKSGITINMVVRLRKPADPQKSASKMMFFHKDYAYFLGITNERFNFSIGTGKAKWNLAMLDGEAPSFNKWTHIAAVISYNPDTAQGNDGTTISLYVNGRLLKSTLFAKQKINTTDAPLLIGGGLKGYELSGDIAVFKVDRRIMSDSEIYDFARKNPLVKLPPSGWYKMPPEVIVRLNAVGKKVRTAHGKWVLECLKKSAFTGEDEKTLCRALSKNADELGLNRNITDMAETFNKAQDDYRIYVTSRAMLLIGRKGSLSSPVLGLYDRRSKAEIFAARTLEWKLRFLDPNGQKIDINSYTPGSSYSVEEIESGKNGAVLKVTWRHTQFTAESTLNFSGSRLTADFEVKNKTSDMLLTNAVFPCVRIAKLPGKSDKLVYPYMSGMLVNNPTHRSNFGFEYPRAEFGMQFIAYYDDAHNGVYYSMEDPEARYKRLSLSGMNQYMIADWNHPVAYPAGCKGGNNFKMSGKAVIEMFRGTWYHAGKIYRRFLENDSKWWIKDLPRKSTPEWFRNNSWSIIATASPKSLEEAIYLSEYFETPPVIQWAIWHKYDIGDEGLRIFPYQSTHKQTLEKAKKHNIKLSPYMNPHIWGFAPGTTRNPPDWHKNKAALRAAVKYPDGKPEFEIYGKPYFVICPYEKNGQADVAKQNLDILKIWGFPAVYLDQLACHEPSLCFDPAHGHPMNDASLWMAKSNWPLWKKIRSELKAHDPDFVITAEDASDPYLNIIDGYVTWRWINENRIPLYQSIYAGRVQFVGRCSDAHNSRGEGDYLSFFTKTAEQLVYGEQIGWFHLNDMYHASPHRIFTKKMILMRKLLAPFLNVSEMLEPVRFAKAPPQITSKWAWSGMPQNIVMPQILSSAWRNEKTNTALMIFVNPAPTAASAKVVVRKKGYDTLYICREGKDLQKISLSQKTSVHPCTLAPRSGELWILSRNGDGAEKLAAESAALLKRMASFDDPGKILYRPQNFKKCNKIDARSGRWVTPANSSWMKKCFMPVEPTFGWGDGRFIQADANGEVFWGEVDFGENGGSALEIMVAADARSAGGKIEFYQAENGKAVNAPFAVIDVPLTGDWFDFKTLKSEITGKIAGKMNVITVFKGKGCVIRKWRVVK